MLHFKIVVFPLGRQDPALELQIDAVSVAIARNSVALCTSVSANRIGMASSSFRAAAAACVNFLGFA